MQFRERRGDRIRIKRNDSRDMHIIVGLYKGEMLTDVAILNADKDVLDAGLALPSDISNTNIRVFAWDGLLNKIQPFNCSYRVPMAENGGVVTIYTIGDSLMQTITSEVSEQQGWPQFFEKNFNPDNVRINNQYSKSGRVRKVP